MHLTLPSSRTWLAGALLFMTATLTAELGAQQRLLLPEGTVLTVRTESQLSSRTAREGETFHTTVTDSVRVEGFTVIPEGSTVEGVVTYVRRASTRASGVIGVDFTRLQLPSGSAVAIDGKLTSLDPSERRQIDAQPDAQVVFVGGRRGAGAAIGAVGGTPDDPLAGFLGALGTLLSKGADVTVPANTQLAVQLERGITMRVVGTTASRRPDAFSIYTSTDAIMAAQRSLQQKGYYRGRIDGTLNEATQRALVEFQIDSGIIVTGNLDGRTADALGLEVAGAGAGAGALTLDEASLLRRNAQLLTSRYRASVGVTQAGRLDPRRFYEEGELELYFALSAFTDNASLYEEMVRVSGNVDGLAAAGAALVEAARRVDGAIRNSPMSSRLAAAWGGIQQDLTGIDASYPSAR